MIKNPRTGFAIALAWPQTYCKQAGAWYDSLMNLLGFAKDHYYKVGHAAVVLIDAEDGKCHYFDFGRYHAPFGYGRVRNEITDHDLKLPIKAIILEQSIVNFEEIIAFLSCNDACHGAGAVEASYCEIDFERAYQNALKMQAQSPIAYGPFIWQGTNCSRFVRTTILAGKPNLLNRLKLLFPLTISPTPSWNVRILSHPKSPPLYLEDAYYGTFNEAKNYPC